MLLEFLPGHLAPSLTRRAFRLRRCFPLFHLTHFLPSIQQGPRQHILWLSQRRWLFGPSFRKRHWLAPTRSIDLSCESALAVSPFQSSVLCDHRCVPVHRAPSWVSRERRTILPLSPFVAGGAVTILVKPLILRRLGPLLQRFYRTFTYVSGWKHCSSSSPTCDLAQSRLLIGPLFHPAFLIDDQSLQEGCVISRSSGWLGIAPNVRRLVVSVFLFLGKTLLLVPREITV